MSASAIETCGCGATLEVKASMITLVGYRLDEFRAAHAGCRIPPGPCMAHLDAFRGEGPVAYCTLLHGHKGGHTDGQTSWTDLPTDCPPPASRKETP